MWKETVKNKIFLWMRPFEWWWQRRTRGWDDREIWNLDNTISKFIYPRLKRLQEVNHGYPSILTPKKWKAIVDDMLFAFDKCSTVRHDYTSDDWKRIDRGLRYFAKYYHSLWD